MYLKKLSLTNFKNLNKEIDLKEGINVLLAPNGTGKTNVLEAIYILSNGESFHSYPEKSLINYQGVDFAKVVGVSNEHTHEVIISVTNDFSSQKKLLIDGTAKSNSKFSSFFQTILFSPSSVDLISGGPDLRRKELDILISKLDKTYSKNLNTYRSVIRNRNKLLVKLDSGLGTLEELDFWNDKMIDLGSQIITKRLEIIEILNQTIREISSKLFHTELKDLVIKYDPSVNLDGDIKSNFANRILEELDKEINMGHSLFGPHRDDYIFELSGQDVKYIGSRGQQRISVLLFLLAGWDISFNANNSKPILLLDDIMSELDKTHRENIMKYILSSNYGQIIITTSEEMNFMSIQEVNTIAL